MREWKNVATLTKTRRLNGRFVARPAADFPFMLAEGLEVAFVPPRTDLPRSGSVDFVCDIDGSSYEVGFDTVGDEAAAHGLVGCRCLVRRADIDEDALEQEPASWLGWRVVQQGAGYLGDVEELVENPGQSLLEVRRENGKPAYIPVVDEFIRDVNVETRTVTVDLPAGLLDL